MAILKFFKDWIQMKRDFKQARKANRIIRENF